MIGTVTGTPEVARVRNGTGYALMLQVQFSDQHDVRTVQYMPASGEDTVPMKGDKVTVVDVGGLLVAVASYDCIQSVRGSGEKEIYSRDGKTKLFRLVLKASGLLFAGSTKNGKNLYDEIKNLADAVKTLAQGTCMGTCAPNGAPLVGSTLSNSATVIQNVNTMISNLQKILTNDPGDM